MAVAALILLGLGMAGAFPTTTAFTGDLMGNSPLGMSVFTGIGSLGGILTPQVIGVLADKLGGDHVPGAGRFPSGAFWRRSTPVRREKSQIVR